MISRNKETPTNRPQQAKSDQRKTHTHRRKELTALSTGQATSSARSAIALCWETFLPALRATVTQTAALPIDVPSICAQQPSPGPCDWQLLRYPGKSLRQTDDLPAQLLHSIRTTSKCQGEPSETNRGHQGTFRRTPPAPAPFKSKR